MQKANIHSTVGMQANPAAVNEMQLRVMVARNLASLKTEVGYAFKFNGQPAYFNLRDYWEFWAQNRVEGYALFGTLSIPVVNAGKQPSSIRALIPFRAAAFAGRARPLSDGRYYCFGSFPAACECR
jgi:hypothetical protein